MKRVLLVFACILSTSAFGMYTAFSSFCAGIRWGGATMFPLLCVYNNINEGLKPFKESSNKSTDIQNEIGIAAETINPHLITIAGKEIPVVEGAVPTFQCRSHLFAYWLGNSSYPYSIEVPANTMVIQRIVNPESNDGLTIPEYKDQLANNISRIDPSDLNSYQSFYKSLFEHITKKEIAAVLEHEQGHGERPSALYRLGSGIAVSAGMIAADYRIMQKLGNIAPKNIALRSLIQFPASLCAASIYDSLSRSAYYAFCRQDEHYADRCIQRDHIPDMISYLEKSELTYIIIAEQAERNRHMFINNANTHPSYKDRIEQLQRRLNSPDPKEGLVR